jgi:hypothetical protein
MEIPSSTFGGGMGVEVAVGIGVVVGIKEVAVAVGGYTIVITGETAGAAYEELRVKKPASRIPITRTRPKSEPPANQKNQRFADI